MRQCGWCVLLTRPSVPERCHWRCVTTVVLDAMVGTSASAPKRLSVARSGGMREVIVWHNTCGEVVGIGMVIDACYTRTRNLAPL